MTPEERDKLQNDYAYAVINDMELSYVIDYAAQSLNDDLENNTSNDELIALVKELYPELLNDT
jgi:hypothetical protein